MARIFHAAVILVLAWAWTSMAEAADSTWRNPDPFRLEGITEGRSFAYDTEGFHRRNSYRHLSPARPGEDSLYGTGGSVTSDELYLDINLQKTLHSDDERFSVMARMQRSEDMDGRFDRQLAGVAFRPAEKWEAAFLADLDGDKGAMDLQYELHWQPDRSRRLRLVVVQTDPLYNSKSDSENRYRSRPLSWFAGYHDDSGRGSKELAINVTPDVEYEDRANGYRITASKWRLHSALEGPVGQHGWHGRMSARGERAKRSYTMSEGAESPREDFQRRFHELSASIGRPDTSWRPRVGVRYLRFRERGYSGAGLDRSGWQRRQEWGAFLRLHARAGQRHWWEPVLEVARLERNEEFDHAAPYRKQRTAVRLGLPWRYEVDTDSGAVLTVNLTFRLHAGAFGGGNIQLYWPL